MNHEEQIAALQELVATLRSGIQAASGILANPNENPDRFDLSAMLYDLQAASDLQAARLARTRLEEMAGYRPSPDDAWPQ